MPGKDVYFEVSSLALLVYIFTEYLLFGYVFIQIMLIRRSEFFIDNFREQVKRFRSTVAGQFSEQSCCRHVIKELVHAFSCAYIELWMHLGSLENTQEARVALGCVSSNSYASFVFSKLPACIHNSIYAR